MALKYRKEERILEQKKYKRKNGRSTVYNRVVTPETMEKVNIENEQLKEDFCEYLRSIDRSSQTIAQYKNDLNIFFVWNMQNNGNKFFVDLKKRDIVRFQSWCIEIKWSPKRIRRVKATLSSLSNYIENILDDEYKDFRNIIRKVENPTNEEVREKTIVTTQDIDEVLEYYTNIEEYEKACAVAVCAYSGMRRAELLQMKMSYFDEDHLEFDGALYKTDKVRAKGRGMKGKQINKYVFVAAKPYIEAWRKRREELGIDIDDMFVTFNVKEHKWEPRKTLERWTKEIGFIINKDFYWHSLRHYCCTYLINDFNIPSEVVREFFQWSSADMISIYNDVKTESKFGDYFTKDGIKKQSSGDLSLKK